MGVTWKTLTLSLFLTAGVHTVSAQYSTEDWEDRDTWMQVPKLFDLVGLDEGDFVADIGCHEGYMTMRAARQVGTSGMVYAVDVNQDRLEVLQSEIERRELQNITVVLGNYDDPKLPKDKLDVVLLIDTYHEITAYNMVLGHIKDALKQTGRLLVLEKLKAPHRDKTRKEQAAAHTLSLAYVREELLEAGFTISQEIAEFGVWNHEPEKQMWLLVATKAP